MFRSRAVPLAWRQLFFDKQRLMLSVAGIAFAVLLMFMQTGFQNGILDSCTRVIPWLEADLILAHELRYTVDGTNTFPRGRLYQACACPGVKDVVPLYVTNAGMWKIPGTGDQLSVRVYGIDPDHQPLSLPALTALHQQLKIPGQVLFDVLSRPYYGQHAVGTATSLSKHPIQVIGTFELGPDFTADGNLLAGTGTYFAIFGNAGLRPDDVDYGLVRLEPGARPEVVQAELRRLLPKEIVVYTKNGYIQEINDYFATNGATAVVFGLGIMLGFVIGGFVCYQVLYNDITDHLMQFATLKAIGYRTPFLLKVVVEQALILAVLGFAVGLIPAWLVACYIEESTGLLMRFTLPRMGTVLGLTVVMNQLAGLLAVRKVIQTDPADCF